MSSMDECTKFVDETPEAVEEVIQDVTSVKGPATEALTEAISEQEVVKGKAESDNLKATDDNDSTTTKDNIDDSPVKDVPSEELTPTNVVKTSTENTETEGSEKSDSPKAPKRSSASFSLESPESPPAEKQQRVEDYMPIEVLQTLQQLSVPKLGHNGVPCRPEPMTIVNGKFVLPEMGPLEQCQQLQQIQQLIHYHEQQVKYRSYIQLEMLRSLRKQLNDQMMAHPHRKNYDTFVDAMLNNRLTPLSVAEKTQLEYYSQMADWTLEARAILQNKETPTYLNLLGKQVSEFKARLNEIKTHEGFQVYGAMFAERIDYFRELINTLNRRSFVSIS